MQHQQQSVEGFMDYLIGYYALIGKRQDCLRLFKYWMLMISIA